MAGKQINFRWGGAFSPTLTKGKFKNRFKIVSAARNDLTDQVEVVIEFNASPGKRYTFYFEPEDYSRNKDVIADLIQQELAS